MKRMSLCPHSCCHRVSCGERKISSSGSQDWTATPAAVTGTLEGVHHGGQPGCALGCHHRARRKCDQLCHHTVLCVTVGASS